MRRTHGLAARIAGLSSTIVLLLQAQVAASLPRDLSATTVLGLVAGSARAGEEAPVTVTLHDAGAPVAGASLTVERRVAGAWQPHASVVTDPAGTAVVPLTMAPVAGDNVLRASYAGDGTRPPAASAEVSALLVRRSSSVTIHAPRRVRDEQGITVTIRWQTRDGMPVAGPVRLQARGSRRWHTVAEVVTDASGTATAELSPRTDVALRARARALDWVTGDSSGWERVDNVPPAPPVLMRGAPRPRLGLPPQPRADRPGAAGVIRPIPDGVWRSMVGRSWHAGCPVGRAGLRLLRVNYYDYYDYDGYRRRGELVVAASAAARFVAMLTELYDRMLPIRSMYRVDRFGWSRSLRGADDIRSMAAGNTSAFNCRDVVGRPGVRSPHAYGRSIDLNPWENPYRVNGRWLPNAWWAGRSHPRIAWRGRGHAVLEVMRRHGFSWTYGHSDSQHFDARTPDGSVVARCRTVCH